MFKYVNDFNKYLFEKESTNFSFVKNIKKIKGVSSLYKVPRIDKFIKNKDGKMFGLKYIANDYQFRINSKNKNFKAVHSIDFYAKKSTHPVMTIPIDPNISEVDFMKLISITLEVGRNKLNEDMESDMKNAQRLMKFSTWSTIIMTLVGLGSVIYYYIKRRILLIQKRLYIFHLNYKEMKKNLEIKLLIRTI